MSNGGTNDVSTQRLDPATRRCGAIPLSLYYSGSRPRFSSLAGFGATGFIGHTPTCVTTQRIRCIYLSRRVFSRWRIAGKRTPRVGNRVVRRIDGRRFPWSMRVPKTPCSSPKFATQGLSRRQRVRYNASVKGPLKFCMDALHDGVRGRYGRCNRARRRIASPTFERLVPR
jgi:hypothetical protein